MTAASRTPSNRPRLALTAGEPAGIGPELLIRLALASLDADLVAITDRDLLRRAAARCGVQIEIIDACDASAAVKKPHLLVEHVPLNAVEHPGRPDPRNAHHVLTTLDAAADGCCIGRFDAVVTAPLQKATINEAGVAFSGHTEYFAQRAGCDVVMMLASPELRVALATTHLPLARVSAAITADLLDRTLNIVHYELVAKFRHCAAAHRRVRPQSARRRRRSPGARRTGYHRTDACGATRAGDAADRSAAGRHRFRSQPANTLRRGAGDVSRSGTAGAQERGLRAYGEHHLGPALHPHIRRPTAPRSILPAAVTPIRPA